jgi:hypothetical protein
MQEFNEIEALWAKHTVEVKISADEMLKQVKRSNHSADQCMMIWQLHWLILQTILQRSLRLKMVML